MRVLWRSHLSAHGPDTGLNAGQVASMTSQPTKHMSTEEILAPWPTHLRG
jgi:hypothetical protein